jgi:hypothetical protein
LLEPRTPRQPEKLKKLSKNDYVSTPFKFCVNENIAVLCVLFSVKCSWFTAPCQNLVHIDAVIFAAAAPERAISRPKWNGINDVRPCDRGCIVHIPRNPLWARLFNGLQRSGSMPNH